MDYNNKSKEELVAEIQALQREYDSLKELCGRLSNGSVRNGQHIEGYLEFLQKILESISYPFYVIDASDFNIVLANRQTDDYEPGVTKCYKLTHKRDTPCDCHDHPCPLSQIVKTGKPLVTEHVHYDKGNERRIVEVHAHPVFGADGSVQQIIEFVVDITERKKTEEELLRLRTAIWDSMDAVFLTEAGGVITFVNPAFTKLYGYSEAEVVGKVTPRILKGGLLEQSVYEEFWKKILSKEELKTEYLNRKKDGTLVEIEATANAIVDARGKIIGFLSIQRDITELKQNQRTIEEQNIQLKELNATKDKFFSIIAHDLRSPFTAIIGFSRLLTQNIDTMDTEKIRSYTGYIETASNETFKLLENLLEWSRLQQGKIAPKMNVHNLKNIISEICMLYNEVAANKEISIQNNITADILVYCDMEMVKTILRNLLSNAIKFSVKDSAIIIDSEVRDALCRIKISDSGIGIPPESIPYIFGISKNVSRRGTAGESGTGLGLKLCKDLVELQQGNIGVESEEGKGSVFHFSLKLAKLGSQTI